MPQTKRKAGANALWLENQAPRTGRLSGGHWGQTSHVEGPEETLLGCKQSSTWKSPGPLPSPATGSDASTHIYVQSTGPPSEAPQCTQVLPGPRAHPPGLPFFKHGAHSTPPCAHSQQTQPQTPGHDVGAEAPSTAESKSSHAQAPRRPWPPICGWGESPVSKCHAGGDREPAWRDAPALGAARVVCLVGDGPSPGRRCVRRPSEAFHIAVN